MTPPMTARPSGARKSAPSPRAERHRNHAGDERERRHQDRPQADAPGLDERLAPRHAASPRAHLAKSISRIAFFATMPISRITPIRLMMLSVSPVTQQRQHHADERERQRDQDRQRIEERSELHDEDEVHQQHRDAERGEDAAEHLVLILGLAALA